MALENLYIKTVKSISGIVLDAVISESHNSTTTLTDTSVEFGTNPTDHAVIEPLELSIVVSVSDTPLGIASVGQIVDFVTGLFGTSTEGNVTRSASAYNAFEQLRTSRTLLEIRTKLRTYSNMVIVGIPITQDVDTSRVVDMTINLRELIIVNTQIERLPNLEGRVKDQGADPTDRGRQDATEPDDTTNRSVIQTWRRWRNGE